MSNPAPSTARQARRWPVVAVVFALVGLMVGYVAATGLSSALAISYNAKELPVEPVLDTPAADAPAPAPDLRRIVLPKGGRDDVLLTAAATRLADALEHRGAARPVIEEGDASALERPASPLDQRPTPVAGTLLVAESASVPERGYLFGAGTLQGGDRNGMADGLFAAAMDVEGGKPLPDVSAAPVVADLRYRYVDLGAVGVVPDEAAYRSQADYSHTSGAFADVVLADAPYVDPAGLAAATADWKQYVDHIRAYGYNGIVVPGFLEYVNFDRVGSGTEVYAADSPYRARHDAMVAQFGAMWRYAADMGMEVVFKTDMLALTKPLEDYFTRTLGGIDVDDPRLWAVYREGLVEFFDAMPFVTGLMIRIGEAGRIYDLPGWDYYSALKVTSVRAVRTMLTEFTSAAAEADRTIFFRTWSVGVGEVGDMHTNATTYDAVLGGLDADNLVVVTKYTMGDFYSWLPRNPTLRSGDQPRVVEFQSRREFEAFSAIPNHLTAHQQTALQDYRSANPNIQGIWVWTQDGGPWRAGPMSLYLKTGFWQLYDADVYATGRLGWDADADVGVLTRDWVTRTFSDDPSTVDALMGVLARSRQVVREGLYVAPFAEEQVLALGLEPPPMLWIFEWDMVSGDSAALSAVHHVARDRVAEAIDRGEAATAAAADMLATVEATPASAWHDPAMRERMLHSLRYEADLFGTLGAFRAAFLSYYSWLDTGDRASWDAWQAARGRYESAVAAHRATYSGDLDTPPYEFFAVDVGFGHAERTTAARIATGLVLLGIVALALLGALAPRVRHRASLLVAARGLWLGATRPWRLADDPLLAVPRPAAARWLVWVLPAVLLVLSRSAFSDWMSWAYLLVTLGSMLLYVLAVRLLLRRVDGFALYAAAGGALLLKTLLLCLVTVTRGPLGYWYRFWTDEQWRTLHFTLAIAAFLWLFFVTYAVLRASYGRTRPRALGIVLVGVAAPMLALGGLMAASGLEAALTTFNNQMALLPMGLSRILGLTVHLGIPTEIPMYVLVLGGLLAAAGLLLGAARRTVGRA